MPPPAEAVEKPTAPGKPSLSDFTTQGGQFDPEAARRSGIDGPMRFDDHQLRIDPHSGSPVFTRGPGAEPRGREEGDWLTFPGNGADGDVHAVAVFGGALFLGGNFSRVGGVPAENIARWDGASWKSVGWGTNGPVRTLAVFDGILIAGGEFSSVDEIEAFGIAQWNGNAWAPMGSGVNGAVHALTVHAENLIAGGDFTRAGGRPANRIARWDGDSWHSVEQGMNGSVHALASHPDRLVVAGEFTEAGSVSARYIAAFNGRIWSPIGEGLPGPGRALAVHGRDLVAGGESVRRGYVLHWSGTEWNDVATTNGAVRALASHGGSLIAAGDFTKVADLPIAYIARWSRGSWSSLGAGANAGVECLVHYSDHLIAGGKFEQAGEVMANHIASWDGKEWIALELGMNGIVWSLAVYNGDVIAGGEFTQAGGVRVDGIARWDGVRWHRLGQPPASSPVYCMTVFDGELAVGTGTQWFSQISGKCLAWDGTSWRELDDGPSGWVRALDVYEGDLIAAGHFSMPVQVDDSGSPVLEAWNIARWDGSQWHEMGAGTNDMVYALAVYDGDLIVGGRFDTAGGWEVGQITRYSGGCNWWKIPGAHFYELKDQYGEVVGGRLVYDLAIHDGDLIAAGEFNCTIESGELARGVVRYDGENWDSMDGLWKVYAIEVHESKLYAGDCVWDGENETWNTLGSGIYGYPLAMVSHEDGLFVGGYFWKAGDEPSYNIACWKD